VARVEAVEARTLGTGDDVDQAEARAEIARERAATRSGEHWPAFHPLRKDVAAGEMIRHGLSSTWAAVQMGTRNRATPWPSGTEQKAAERTVTVGRHHDQIDSRRAGKPGDHLRRSPISAILDTSTLANSRVNADSRRSFRSVSMVSVPMTMDLRGRHPGVVNWLRDADQGDLRFIAAGHSLDERGGGAGAVGEIDGEQDVLDACHKNILQIHLGNRSASKEFNAFNNVSIERANWRISDTKSAG